MTREDLIKLFDKNKEDISKYEKNKKRLKDINNTIEKIKKKVDTKITTVFKEIPMWAIRQNCLEKITMRRNLLLMQRLSVIPHWKSWKSIKRPMKSELC